MATDAPAPATALQGHEALLHHWLRSPPWPDDGPLALVQTHLSSLLLGRQWVLKLKKPIALDFVDFRSVDSRRHFCEEELRLNRRTAPAWYVDVLPVTGSVDAPQLGGTGEPDEPFDWALRMRRFDADATYDRLAAAGTLGEAQIDALAARVAAFHRALPPSPAAWGDPQVALGFALDNLRTLAAALPAEAAALAALREWTVARHAALAPLVDALVAPASPGPAPLWAGDVPGQPLKPRPTGDAVFNTPSSGIGAPAVTVPICAVGGMPMGIQVMTQPHMDAQATAVARWMLETLAPVIA